MRSDECAERVEFEKHAVFARETGGDFRERLKQDESNGM